MARFSFSFLSTLFLCLGANLITGTAAIQQVVQPPAAHDPSNLIAVACQRAIHKQFCIDVITSDRNTAKADLKGFAFIALRASEKNATAASIFTKQSLSNPGMDSQPDLQQALSDCSDHYITAVELIGDSISALLSDNQDDVYKFVKAAIADIDSCDVSLKDYDVVAKEVTQKNSALRLLFSTSLDIVDAAKIQN